MRQTRACRWLNRWLRRSALRPYVFVVVCLALVVGWVDRGNDQQRDTSDQKSAETLQAVCDYANRIAAGARLDRQFLVVLSTRPGLPPDESRKRIIDAYVAFGDEAYPVIDCDRVVAGEPPPPLPPLPESPLAATTTSVP